MTATQDQIALIMPTKGTPEQQAEAMAYPRGYRSHPMQPHQERVLQEKADLDDRLAKLTTFLETDTFRALPEEDRELLFLQWGLMQDLSDILAKRIGRF